MFKIGKVEFKKNKTVIIAEAGVNHNGQLKFGKRLIDEAKKAGADIIKFQTYKAEELISNKKIIPNPNPKFLLKVKFQKFQHFVLHILIFP